MCVIAYKAKDVRFPSAERIRECWDANPDGAGIMWRDNNTNKIKFVKGFMSVGKLEKFIRKHKDMLEESECALHFRITTHGGTSQGNCHPFVCDCDADPHLLEGEADFVMMHNGVLPIGPRRKDISDSAELALRIGRYADPMGVMDVCDEMCKGSRIIVFGPEGTMTYGDKFRTVGNDGILYSNDHWDGYNDYGWYFQRDNDCHNMGFGKAKEVPTYPAMTDVDKYLGAKYDGKNVSKSTFIVWSEAKQKFLNPFTGIEVGLEEIDPDMLASEDYDKYLEMLDEKKVEESVCNDPELIEEAHYYGMSVSEYLDYMRECGHTDNGAVTEEVAASI